MIKLKFRYHNSLKRTNISFTHEEIKLSWSCFFVVFVYVFCLFFLIQQWNNSKELSASLEY